MIKEISALGEADGGESDGTDASAKLGELMDRLTKLRATVRTGTKQVVVCIPYFVSLYPSFACRPCFSTREGWLAGVLCVSWNGSCCFRSPHKPTPVPAHPPARVCFMQYVASIALDRLNVHTEKEESTHLAKAVRFVSFRCFFFVPCVCGAIRSIGSCDGAHTFRCLGFGSMLLQLAIAETCANVGWWHNG